MFWVFILLFLGVIGAKYYTALGTRNLERRLNRVKNELERARSRLREEHQKQSNASHQEESQELQVRYMRELIQDIQIRLSQSVEEQPKKADARDEVAASMMRF